MTFTDNLIAFFTKFGPVITVVRRPIVTVYVKTNLSQKGRRVQYYDLFVENSGDVPANDIRLEVMEFDLIAAYGREATEDWNQRFLSVFEKTIPVLKNGECICVGSFGYTHGIESGFWKHNAVLPIDVYRKGWLGLPRKETQYVRIKDSDTFTG